MKKTLLLGLALAMLASLLRAEVPGFLYQEDFEHFELGDILKQDSDWQPINSGQGDGVKSEYLVVEEGRNGGKCVMVHQINDWGGTHTTIHGSENLSSNYNIRISFDLLLSSKSDGYGNYYGNDDGLGELNFKHVSSTGGKVRLTFENTGFEFPELISTTDWISVSYVINTAKNSPVLLEATVNGVTVSDINRKITKRSETPDAFPRFRALTWAGKSFLLDNISVEAVSRQAIGPAMQLSEDKTILIKDNRDDVSMTVTNPGDADLEYKLEVTDGSGWLSFRDTKDTTLSGTLAAGKDRKLYLDIDRAALGAQYGRATVKATGAGTEQSVKFYVQGYDQDGAVFYASDFEDTPDGTAKLVDPAFKHDNAQVGNDEDGNRCLKFTGAGETHVKCEVPHEFYLDYDFRFSCRMKFPKSGVSYPSDILATDLDHRMGEYKVKIGDDGLISFKSDDADVSAITNLCQVGEWFDISYTYTADPMNRKLKSVTFGDCTYDLNVTINPHVDSESQKEKGYFNDFRFYSGWPSGDFETYYVDDIVIEAVAKGAEPPVLEVRTDSLPLAYYENELAVTVLNVGGGELNYTVEVLEGQDYVTCPTSGTIQSSGQFKVRIDRSKLGYGFYRPVIRLVNTSSEDQDPILLTLPVQSGSPATGYVLYESDFASLETSEVSESGQITGELSTQDRCWQTNGDHNYTLVEWDPTGAEKTVAKMMNVNIFSPPYPGYTLRLNVPEGACQDYDVVYSMDMCFPEDMNGATLYLSQNNDNRSCEFAFTTENVGRENVVTLNPRDIANTEWWEQNEWDMDPVGTSTWFPFYCRLNTEYIDLDHKTLHSLTFGGNEFQMEGDDAALIMQSDVSMEIRQRTAMPYMRFWCDANEVGIYLDNVKVLLVPKGLPEPAFCGLAALLLLGLARRRS